MSNEKKSSHQHMELSAEKAAKQLGCTQDYIGKLCREGKLVGERTPRGWVVEAVSLRSFEREREAAKLIRAQDLSAERISELKSRTGASMLVRVVAIAGVGLLVCSAAYAGKLVTSGQTAALAHLNSPFFAPYSE